MVLQAEIDRRARAQMAADRERVGPTCPDGGPHRWLIEHTGGCCRRCGAIRYFSLDWVHYVSGKAPAYVMAQIKAIRREAAEIAQTVQEML
mgnify:CR=1 FL=1